MSSARQILSNHVVVRYYNEATNDAKSETADMFWQAVFITHFTAPDFLLTSMEPKSSERRRRVLYFTPNAPGERPIGLLWLEVIDASSSGKYDDRQLVAVGGNSAHAVYAMTVIGTTFKVRRRIGDGTDGLEPVGGPRADDSEYLDAKSDEGCRVFFALREEIHAAHDPAAYR